eukprot:1691705-Rhodomonas_salina.1
MSGTELYTARWYQDGSKLASVGLDLDHSIAVWDWKSQTKLATAAGSTEKIFDIRFNPVDDVLVTCGVRHIKFWTLVPPLPPTLSRLFC